MSAPADSPAVELDDVTLAYGDKVVLDAVSLRIPRGKTTVLLGPSGTGKSTLIRLAVGLQAATRGVVRTLGHDVAKLSRAELLKLRRRFGMLFQDGALFGSLSVAANIGFPLRHHSDMSDAQREARVAELLDLVGLSGLGDRTPEALSGGQRKRVALARAIALEPEIVFFDEPTSGLDPQTSAAIDQLTRDMQARLGLTFIVITHDVQSAEEIADYVGVLHGGKVRLFDTQEAVWSADDDVIQRFIHRQPPR